MEWLSGQQLPPLDSPEAMAILRRKAKKLARLGNLGDAEDVAQELALRLLRKQSRYDPARGEPQAFLSMLAAREAVSLLRYERAQRRFPGRLTSLDAPIADDGNTLSAVIADAEPIGTEVRAADIRQDVATLIGQLSRRDRRLCRLAMRYSVAEIARMTGLPRTTIQSRLQGLRAKFAGLKDFL